MDLFIEIFPDGDGWGAAIPALHVIADGATREEARQNALSAAQFTLAYIAEQGEIRLIEIPAE